LAALLDVLPARWCTRRQRPCAPSVSEPERFPFPRVRGQRRVLPAGLHLRGGGGWLKTQRFKNVHRPLSRASSSCGPGAWEFPGRLLLRRRRHSFAGLSRRGHL